MDAQIIAVGTELLMGETADTNSGWVAQHLPHLGLELRRITVVGDDLEQITDTLREAWADSDYTFVIGGLGPTEDDITRDAVARLFGEQPARDPELVEWLEDRMRRWSRTSISEQNLRQATIIPSAQPIRNTVGTAPGWWVEKDGKVLATMPGPPREMMEMWNGQLFPRLEARVAGVVIRTRTFKTIGLGEPQVDEAVKHLYGTDGLYVGCYVKVDGVHLRAIAKAPEAETAIARLDNLESELRQILGAHLWGIDEETPQQRLGDLLRERGYTVALLESATGGLISGAITEVPGASDYFLGATVTYNTEAKIAAGVDPKVVEQYGAVSAECATEMAMAACRAYGADCGIGVTGVAGPTEMEGRPVGLVYIGVAHPGGVSTTEHQFPPVRGMARIWAVNTALLELCQELQKTPAAQAR